MIEQIIFEVLFLRAVDVEPLRFPKKRHKQIKSNPAKILKKKISRLLRPKKTTSYVPKQKNQMKQIKSFTFTENNNIMIQRRSFRFQVLATS